MRIGFLTNDLDLKNGWGNYSANLINGLEAKGVETVVLTGKTSYGRAKKAFRDCNIVHSLVEPLAWLGFRLAGNRPFFITAHGTYAVEPLVHGGWRGFKLRRAYKKARAIFCVSRFTAEQIKKFAPAVRTAVINNGVNFERFQVSTSLTGEYQKLLAGRFPVIMGVGAIKERKGYHLSLAAVAHLKNKYPDFLYLIAGKISDQKYFQRLKGLIGQLGLENNIKFIEPDDRQLAAWYQAIDIFLLTPVSDEIVFEGYGLVYLEAGAAGKPAIGSLNCGAADAILDGQTGWLVNSADEAAIAAAVLKLTDDGELRERMGRAAQEFARQRTWLLVADEYLKFYQSVIK